MGRPWFTHDLVVLTLESPMVHPWITHDLGASPWVTHTWATRDLVVLALRHPWVVHGSPMT